MTRKEAKQLYEGKFFYQVIKTTYRNNKGEEILSLLGPCDDIFYAVPKSQININNDTVDTNKYKFLRVEDGIAQQAFTEEEILVTDRKL